MYGLQTLKAKKGISNSKKNGTGFKKDLISRNIKAEKNLGLSSSVNEITNQSIILGSIDLENGR